MGAPLLGLPKSIYYLECKKPLGMETGAIPDSQITASSQWDENHAPFQGRLNFQWRSFKAGGWSAASNDANQWLAIDLGHTGTVVTRIATQGKNHPDPYMQWVATYKLQYSNDLVTVLYYREQGQSEDKVNIEFMNQNFLYSLFFLQMYPVPLWYITVNVICINPSETFRSEGQAKTKISLLWSTLQTK